jgi:hypothetical protein
MPALASLSSAYLSRRLFVMNGTATTPVWLILKITFAASVFLGLFMLMRLPLLKKHTEDRPEIW